jgi:hypothetical protein
MLRTMTVMFVAPEPEPVQIESLLAAGLEGPDTLRSELAALSDRDARALIAEVEAFARRVGAIQVAMLDDIEDRRLPGEDGHVSAKVMVRHLAKLSPGEAAGREKCGRMLNRLEAIAEAYTSGEVGTDQVRLLGRVHSNRRVAAHMADYEDWLLDQAKNLEFVEFEAVISQWERLMDQDGAELASERAHRNRDFSMTQDHFGLGWEIRGGTGPLAGAAMAEIHQHYVTAELLADWEQARALHGDDATIDDLARTDAQRRADALRQIFDDAASVPPDSTGPRFVHNIKWDQKTFQQMLSVLAGGPDQRLEIDTRVCETLDGVPLAPAEAIVNAYLHEFRRVMVDSAGTVIDLGVARRFTGSARLAVQLQANHCIWPGCHQPLSQCEIDHNHPHSAGGSTNPGNGAPLCGRHNRWKQKHFTVWRDPDGVWHTHRPDGTEIT